MNKGLASIFDPKRFSDVSAERSIIGAILADPESYWLVREQLDAGDFSDEVCKKLFLVAGELIDEKGTAWDEVILMDRIREKGWDEEIDMSIIFSIYEEASPQSVLPTACEIVKDKAIKRKLRDFLVYSASSLKEGKLTLEGFVSGATKLAESEVKVESLPLSAVAKEVLNKLIEAREKKEEPIETLSTGYVSLDVLLSGIHRKDYVVIGARPSVGKTAFAICLALNMHKDGEKPPVLFISLEMPAEWIAMRVLANVSGVSFRKLKTGTLSEEDVDKLVSSYTMFAQEMERIRIIDGSYMTVQDLRVQVITHVNKYGTKVVIVDYLQYLYGKRRGSEQENVSEVSRELKNIAKKYDVAVIALAQLNRNMEQRQDKEPMMSDLRASGQIEQDADIILFLHRPGLYKKKATEQDKEILEVKIAKHRNGLTGKIEMRFFGDTQRVEDTGSMVIGSGEGEDDETDDTGDVDYDSLGF